MSSFGVEPEGFNAKDQDDVQTEVEDDLRSSFGASLNLLATSVIGQIVGVFTDKITELWEVMSAVYRSQYPDSASGDALDNVCAITGVTRLAAQPSTVTLDQLVLNGGVTVPAGRIVSVGENGNRFVTLADVTNPNAYQITASVQAESEQTGEVAGFAKTIDTIVTPIAGWLAKAAVESANAETYNLSGGETLLVKIDQGSAQTITFQAGDFAVAGAATAAEVVARIDSDLVDGDGLEANGKVLILSDTDGEGSAVEITGGTANTALGFPTTEIKGFNSQDVILGRDIETDVELRQRREQLLATPGVATVEALLAAVLSVEDILDAFIYENVTDVTDADGVPPHSFESVIRGPAAVDADIAQAIFDTKAAGIQAYGTTVIAIEDSQGISHNIGFTRAAEVRIYQAITVVTNTHPTQGPTYPADGDAQVAAALAAKGSELGIGADVIYEAIKCVAFDVSGVVDITAFTIDISAPPTGTSNIGITSRQIPTFSTGDITVTS
jgi:hypothetical protein